MSKDWWDYNLNALMREHADGRFVALSMYLKTLAERDSNYHHPLISTHLLSQFWLLRGGQSDF